MKKVLLFGLLILPTALFSQCIISYFDVTVGPCDPNDGNFDLNGEIQFISPPLSGQLIIEDCNGNQATFNAPFISPLIYSIPDILADGTSNCSVTAYFSADPGCTSTSLMYNNPPACNSCDADIGTFTDSLNGTTNLTNPWYLCYGDVLNITGNGDFVAPNDETGQVFGITYDPGQWLLVYSCPPTVGPPNDINTDTCLLGIANTANGAWDIINNTGDGLTYWYVPVTMYSITDGVYAVSVNGGPWCYDMGPTYEVTFLEEIISTEVLDGVNGTITVTVSGGMPALNGSEFNITVVTPPTAVLSQSTVANDSTFVISNLQNGQSYQYVISDSAGCEITIGAPDPFIGIGELNSEQFVVYPNPTSGVFTVASSQQGELMVRDLAGRFIRNGKLNEEIDLGDQPAGIYMVYVKNRVYRIGVSK